MCRDILGVHPLSIAALISVEGVIKPELRPCRRGSVVLKVGGKALVQPQLAPVVTCHQIPKPLQISRRHLNLGFARHATQLVTCLEQTRLLWQLLQRQCRDNKVTAVKQ